MTRLRTIIFIFIISCGITSRAQDTFFNPENVQEIRLSFQQTNWNYVLDSLFVNYGDEGRLIGNVAINGRLFKNVGVRYKGYSSWNESEIKNPLNIDLDYVLKNQNYQGHTKIKLSNVIHDPSFVREVLSYEIARKYMPSSRANFAMVYVNDSLIGLYTNVEAVDKYFLDKNFGSNSNSFFKGEPETLVYPFGQNANLAYTHGNDSLGYMAFYKLESETGWNDLFNFIRILNNTPDSLDSVVNTDRALWMSAFNYSLLNLDSYIGYAQNYYLYKDASGRFNPIIWDLNMSFGSFRESDGSNNFLGLTIPKLKTLDPLQHLHFSISPRPLMTVLFRNDTLRKIYLAHIRTIMNENILNNSYYQRASQLQAIIDPYVKEDIHKFYSYQDFLINIDTTVGGTGNMIQYPGLKNLMNARLQYLTTYPGIARGPAISQIDHEPKQPVRGTPLWIKAEISSANLAILAYRFNHAAVFSKIVMKDDGNSHDGSANDGIYGAEIQPTGNTIQYYIYAENDTAGSLSPERAEYEFYTLQPDIPTGNLVINEVLANGGETKIVGVNTNNGWVELLNTSNEIINLKDFSLALEPTNIKWTFPDTLINPGSFLLVYADGAGGSHAGFTLPQTNAGIVLTQPDGQILDSINYYWQIKGKSTGRYPNGYGPFVYMEPSAGKSNFVGTTPTSGFSIYPSPASDQITIEFTSEQQEFTIEIFNASGQLIKSEKHSANTDLISSTAIPIDVSHYKTGIYIVKLNLQNGVHTKKFIVN